MGGEGLLLGADGGQSTIGQAEVGRRNPGVADEGLRLVGRGRGREEHRPGALRTDGGEREGRVEGLDGNCRDHAGGHSGNGRKKGEEGGEDDGAWRVHCV